MSTLCVPAQVPPVSEDCEQLHKAFSGLTPSTLLELQLDVRSSDHFFIALIYDDLFAIDKYMYAVASFSVHARSGDYVRVDQLVRSDDC
ncbi:hypothetical protein SASPL_137088 [Salvia splendens]|uniref:Uncharacterized protein n=1 Tax=Salvia splendens TaxID=180675 RepID=A0A8X8WUB4_SALSN|nr:hypothetical protein SASPL_137088 [Salvia splendens]